MDTLDFTRQIDLPFSEKKRLKKYIICNLINIDIDKVISYYNKQFKPLVLEKNFLFNEVKGF